DVGEDQVGGQDGLAEVSREHLADVDPELLPEREIETELTLDPLVDLRRSAVPHCRQHGVDRDDTADQERDEQEAEERERDRPDSARHRPQDANRERGRPRSRQRRPDRRAGHRRAAVRSVSYFLIVAYRLFSKLGPMTKLVRLFGCADTSISWNMMM